MSVRLIVLAIGLILVAALSVWLHVAVVPDIAWQGPSGAVSRGWASIASAWPVYGTLGVLVALVGLGAGLIAGETARERDLKAKNSQAKERAARAEEAAQTATQDAQAAVSDERADLERQQQQAREWIAAAKGARAAADQEAQRAQERVEQLETELATIRYRLEHSISANHRRKHRIQRLEAELAALRGEILP